MNFNTKKQSYQVNFEVNQHSPTIELYDKDKDGNQLNDTSTYDYYRISNILGSNGDLTKEDIAINLPNLHKKGDTKKDIIKKFVIFAQNKKLESYTKVSEIIEKNYQAINELINYEAKDFQFRPIDLSYTGCQFMVAVPLHTPEETIQYFAQSIENTLRLYQNNEFEQYEEVTNNLKANNH